MPPAQLQTGGQGCRTWRTRSHHLPGVTTLVEAHAAGADFIPAPRTVDPLTMGMPRTVYADNGVVDGEEAPALAHLSRAASCCARICLATERHELHTPSLRMSEQRWAMVSLQSDVFHTPRSSTFSESCIHTQPSYGLLYVGKVIKRFVVPIGQTKECAFQVPGQGIIRNGIAQGKLFHD
jgi:hypothetical protein